MRITLAQRQDDCHWPAAFGLRHTVDTRIHHDLRIPLTAAGAGVVSENGNAQTGGAHAGVPKSCVFPRLMTGSSFLRSTTRKPPWRLD